MPFPFPAEDFKISADFFKLFPHLKLILDQPKPIAYSLVRQSINTIAQRPDMTKEEIETMEQMWIKLCELETSFTQPPQQPPRQQKEKE